MFYSVYRFFSRFATWAVVAILIVMIFIATQLFAGRREFLGPQNQLLDGRRWYTPAQVSQLFTDLGDQRYVYAATEVTLDLIYPLTYGMLFGILIVQLWGPRRDYLLFAPILAVLFDLLENFTIAYLAITYSGSVSNLAWFAAVSTLLKSFFFLLTLLLILNGGIVAFFRPPRRF